jgi:hypothetical protein
MPGRAEVRGNPAAASGIGRLTRQHVKLTVRQDPQERLSIWSLNNAGREGA